ncbi:Glycogen synthase [bioreactor metagenome]|uniref:Glycogen synthase n=1 Tax=bioreactor metagenome TaxID=1076179 RepID=A0A645DJJ2_9ZZZZ
MVEGRHSFVPDNIRQEMAGKYYAGCTSGILNSPDETSTPESDPYIEVKYNADTHVKAKQVNKIAFQARTGLREDQNAPIFFWPSRLDPMQKGCSLLSDILYNMVHKYWDQGLQVAIVANGSYQSIFRNIVAWHDFYDRVLVCDFDEGLSRLAFAASDFILMPSLFEPCGLPQMTCQYFGSLPVVHDTGGLHDTVERLDVANHTGNGFPFETYDTGGLAWAVDEAMRFWQLPPEVKEPEIARVMRESKQRFNHDVTAQEYIKIYENMLARPLVQR